MTLAVAAATMQPLPASAAPARPGTVTVSLSGDDPAWHATDAAVDDDPFVEATRNALSNADFVVLPAGARSRYVATVRIDQQRRGSVTADGLEAGPSVAVGNWGGGVSLTLPSRKTSLRDLVITDLHVEVFQRSDRRLVWSGSAITAQVDGTQAGSAKALGVKLASALIPQFPVTTEFSISVP